VPGLGTLPLGLANLAACLEDLSHEIVVGEDPARPTPVFAASRVCVIGKQNADLSLQCCHSFFKRRSGHDQLLIKQTAVVIVAAGTMRSKTKRTS
jgi:hypothetical protein